jgi:capsular polysaccharide biosynthesis protein
LNKLDIPLDFPVLIDKVCLNFPQYKELIDIANYKGYPVVGVDRQYRVKINELIYINCPHILPPNIKTDDHRSEDLLFNVNALRDLRNYLLPYSSHREFPKRIFMSRKTASNRKSFNEDAVMQLLSEFGFEAIVADTLSIADQISLFNQAEWIMGGTGAAFTNLLYCNNTTKVILFSRACCLYTPFSTIASALGISLLYITEEDTNKHMVRGGIHDSFEIDIPYLEKKIIELGCLKN